MKHEPQLWTPHRYQQTALKFLHERTTLSTNKGDGGGLLLDPGMGKTSIVLEYLRQLKWMALSAKTLVVAPLRVCYQVWPYEIKDWINFHDLSYTVVHGDHETKRKRLSIPVNMHIINRDNIQWLAQQVKGKKTLPWQTVIIDESTSFKNWSAKRSEAMREIAARIPYRVIMTGTPTPKNLIDLFPQIWLLDTGRALGKDITAFRKAVCMQDGERDHNRWLIRPEHHEEIKRRIEPLVLRLDIQDYLSMPSKIEHTVKVELPPNARYQYDMMEREMFALLESGDSKEAINAGAKYNLCRQIANGGVYDDQRRPVDLHDAKTEACLDIIDELQGKPVMIAYQFEHDVHRLKRHLPHMHVIRGGMQEKRVAALIDAWNSDTLDPPILAVQPKALSFGINMQKGSGRDIIWYGATDSLDDYIQLNARIWRQGVTSTVRIHRICAERTVDELVYERTDEKDDMQTDLLTHLRDYAKRTRE